jgi:SAM-dependent methyltransferase
MPTATANHCVEGGVVKTRYTFDNAGSQTPSRFGALATIYDPGTIRHLTSLGIKRGWHCLEVGAGGGSIAEWLSDQVGPDGRVVATDIDTRFLQGLVKSNLEIWKHDAACDPLPERAFDLIHTRLVLIHIAERENVLERLLLALKPGGWVLLEEYDSLSIHPDPAANPEEFPFKSFLAMQELMTRYGANLRYGRLLEGRLRAHGMTDVAAEGRIFMWHGRSAAVEMYRANLQQLRDDMIENRLITAQELDHEFALLDKETTTFLSPIMWAVCGRRSRNALSSESETAAA